jgi:multiple sugar transport system ATP-binding protein
MSQGRLQQLGAPQEVYDAPANLFVAGFIGSPPMNLLRGRARGGRITAGDFALDAAVPDGEVVLGIRPESLRRAADGMPGLAFQVAVVEPMGDEVVVHGTVAAQLANEGAGDPDGALLGRNGDERRAAAVVRLAPRDRPVEGAIIHLGVDPADVYIFDAASGAAIRGR